MYFRCIWTVRYYMYMYIHEKKDCKILRPTYRLDRLADRVWDQLGSLAAATEAEGPLPPDVCLSVSRPGPPTRPLAARSRYQRSSTRHGCRDRTGTSHGSRPHLKWNETICPSPPSLSVQITIGYMDQAQCRTCTCTCAQALFEIATHRSEDKLFFTALPQRSSMTCLNHFIVSQP